MVCVFSPALWFSVCALCLYYVKYRRSQFNTGGNGVSVFSPTWMVVQELQRPYNQSERHQRELRRTLQPVVMSLILTNAAGNLHNWVNCFI